jgi:hypothetical protein
MASNWVIRAWSFFRHQDLVIRHFPAWRPNGIKELTGELDSLAG